ncbi:MAG: transposase [Chloroflexi bacterium]|nr:transposase [Chloroflexota bacterium]
MKQKRELVKVWLERDLARIKKSRRLCADDRRALSMAVALTLSDKIYERHFDGAIRSEQIIGTLNHLHGHVRGQIILIWDRVRIHISKKVQGYLSEHPEIHIELLPAYTPEFNPEEYGHDNVKQHLRNARPSNKNEIHLMLDHGFAHLRRQPDLLLSFFHATGLSVRQLWLT